MSLKSTLSTRAPGSTLLIRLLVGFVFITAGFEKFFFPETRGAQFFAKVGVPIPEFFAPLDGFFELLCGSLIVLGILTRLATIPLLIDIILAILMTKAPLFIAQGFWGPAHEARTDFSMFVCLLFLLIVGAGTISFDYLLSPKEQESTPPRT